MNMGSVDRATVNMAVITGVILDTHDHGPRRLPINMGVQVDRRVYGPCSRLVNTGSVHGRGRCWTQLVLIRGFLWFQCMYAVYFFQIISLFVVSKTSRARFIRQLLVLRCLSCSQSPAMFAYTNSTARPSLYYHPHRDTTGRCESPVSRHYRLYLEQLRDTVTRAHDEFSIINGRRCARLKNTAYALALSLSLRHITLRWNGSISHTTEILSAWKNVI